MSHSIHHMPKAMDTDSPERDRLIAGAPWDPWQPLTDNDDDGGDHTTDVDPEI